MSGLRALQDDRPGLGHRSCLIVEASRALTSTTLFLTLPSPFSGQHVIPPTHGIRSSSRNMSVCLNTPKLSMLNGVYSNIRLLASLAARALPAEMPLICSVFSDSLLGAVWPVTIFLSSRPRSLAYVFLAPPSVPHILQSPESTAVYKRIISARENTVLSHSERLHRGGRLTAHMSFAHFLRFSASSASPASPAPSTSSSAAPEFNE